MRRISNLNILMNNIQRDEFFVVGPKIDLKSFSIIPHLKNGRIKIVLDVYSLISANAWSRSNLIYVYTLFIKEVMKNNVRIYLFNSKNETKNTTTNVTTHVNREQLYYRNFREIKSIGKLLGITNKEQILS